jgi:polyphosphate kinase 2 (PPK2 family)
MKVQNLMYAENKHSILIVIQAWMPAARTGSHAMYLRAWNPRGVNVNSFRRANPAMSLLTIFCRASVAVHLPVAAWFIFSTALITKMYLLTRVHGLTDDDTAHKRMHAINDFERLLTRHNDTHILKIYLHVSHNEQLKRLEERFTTSLRKCGNTALMISKNRNSGIPIMKYCRRASLPAATTYPWHIIPADQNWYKSLLGSKSVTQNTYLT